MLRSPFIREFEEDPFFAAQRDHMMSMGSMFQMHDPFYRPQIVDSRIAERERRSHDRQHQVARRQVQQQATPFGMMSIGFNGMMSNMEKMMTDMHKRFEQPPMPCPTNGGQNFMQSSYVSYSNGGHEAPRVYQSSTSQRCRGGAVEVKKTERDSTTGVEKVQIGHKIGDREHKIEKQKNSKTGEHVENQEFVNLTEDDAETFDHEFQDKVCQTMPVRGVDARRHRTNPTDGYNHSHSHTQRPRQITAPAPAPRYRPTYSHRERYSNS